MNTRHVRRFAAAAALAGLAGAARAHTGHDGQTLMLGLVHPFGADHLLAMVAVGVWSVGALPAGRVWQGPAAFLLALIAGAGCGWLGWTVPFLEHGVALTLVLLGALLLPAARPLPPAAGLVAIAAAAGLHGLLHGAEAPSAGFAGYALGFLLTTVALHLGGLRLGLALRQGRGRREGLALRGLGGALGMAGLILFGQLAA